MVVVVVVMVVVVMVVVVVVNRGGGEKRRMKSAEPRCGFHTSTWVRSFGGPESGLQTSFIFVQLKKVFPPALPCPRYLSRSTVSTDKNVLALHY